MEQKLAEFRVRKKVERQATKTENQAASGKLETQSVPDDATTQSNITIKEERRDWMALSAIGCWPGVRCLAVGNLTVLKVLLWLVLLGLFIELEFGLPFFVLSLFYWLYEGLRSPVARRPGELSAYSVFNPNCQPIPGTLTAEQLEGEMGYRPLNRRVNT